MSEELIKGFYLRTFYKRPHRAMELYFGLYSPSGGSVGEMCIYWRVLAGKLMPCLEAYQKTWPVLATLTDILNSLAQNANESILPKDMITILKKHGFQDYDNLKMGVRKWQQTVSFLPEDILSLSVNAPTIELGLLDEALISIVIPHEHESSWDYTVQWLDMQYLVTIYSV